MKKMMIAAVAVAFAAVAQAATYNWSVSTTTASYNGYAAPDAGVLWSGATPTSMSYYLINEAVLAQADLLTAIREKTDWSSAVLKEGSTGADGKIAKVTFSTTDTTSLKAYVLLINEDNDFAYMSASQTKTGDASGGQVDFSPAITTSKKLVSADFETAYSGAGWYATQAVPEPTSGLLMLLGMAGLALRRRRA